MTAHEVTLEIKSYDGLKPLLARIFNTITAGLQMLVPSVQKVQIQIDIQKNI